MQKTTIRLYFPHQLGEIGLQQRATLVVNTPSCSIPSGVKVTGLDLHGEELQLCPKLKKDHDCVTKTLHEELFVGGAKVDVTFYCKGSNSGGCKTKKPARVCLCITLIYEIGIIKIISAPFTVKGNRRQKIKRMCNSTRRENLSVITVIDNPSLITEVPLVPTIPPPPLPSMINSKLTDLVRVEQPKNNNDKILEHHNHCPQVISYIKQESSTTSSDQFLQTSSFSSAAAQKKRTHHLFSFTPKTEDSIQFRPITNSLLPYYNDSGGSIDMDNSHAQYFHNSTSNNAFLYQKGPFTPVIPPDEEGDNDYYSDPEDYPPFPLVKVEPYTSFNTPGMDKPSFDSFLNVEYYQSFEPREEVHYGYRVIKRQRCLDGNVLKNL